MDSLWSTNANWSAGTPGSGWDVTIPPGSGVSVMDLVGRPLPSGVYFYRVSDTLGGATEKMVIRR